MRDDKKSSQEDNIFHVHGKRNTVNTNFIMYTRAVTLHFIFTPGAEGRRGSIGLTYSMYVTVILKSPNYNILSSWELFSLYYSPHHTPGAPPLRQKSSPRPHPEQRLSLLGRSTPRFILASLRKRFTRRFALISAIILSKMTLSS